ncbi:MAG: HU family DNA-binding protein [candidate division WOR-3 bacterium]|nr:HU family DNA-binding protein [candidate division WOR-3 bacterium]MCX7947637.1 HU family DNA-binding protein [candidate division WOR-3 bacterium]MDW8150515.1 HU family DNA-binding protein [candidate division WOR-3 bacterium]
MNKAQLISEVAKRAGLTKKDSKSAVDAVLSAIKDALSKGQKVRLIGFGTFEVRKRSARKGKNPKTGQTINIPARKVPAFKPSSELRKAVK